MTQRVIPLACPVSHPAAWITRLHGVRPDVYGPVGWPRGHGGIDIAAPKGTPVVACLRNIVVHAGPIDGDDYSGLSVVVWHRKQRLMSLYSHLDEVHVKRGDAAFGTIGTVGNTGSNSSGDHLHFGLALVKPGTDPLAGHWQYCKANPDDGYRGWGTDPLPYLFTVESDDSPQGYYSAPAHPPITDEAMEEAHGRPIVYYLPQFNTRRRIDGVDQYYAPQTGESMPDASHLPPKSYDEAVETGAIRPPAGDTARQPTPPPEATVTPGADPSDAAEPRHGDTRITKAGRLTYGGARKVAVRGSGGLAALLAILELAGVDTASLLPALRQIDEWLPLIATIGQPHPEQQQQIDEAHALIDALQAQLEANPAAPVVVQVPSEQPAQAPPVAALSVQVLQPDEGSFFRLRTRPGVFHDNWDGVMLLPGDWVTLTDRVPVMVSGYAWQEVVTADGTRGWTIEDALVEGAR